MIKMREGIGVSGLEDMIKCIPGTNVKMVEVGSYAGESAEIFAKSEKIGEIWCIDPWKPGYDSGDLASISDFGEVETAFDKVAEKYKDKIRKFRGTLKDFQAKFPDYAPDFVYIDANHTYGGCKSDIETALLWKEIPAIGGHDYASWGPGVVKSVNEVFGRPTATFLDSSWLKVF